MILVQQNPRNSAAGIPVVKCPFYIPKQPKEKFFTGLERFCIIFYQFFRLSSRLKCFGMYGTSLRSSVKLSFFLRVHLIKRNLIENLESFNP